MPYKGVESLAIEEECIRRWVSDLNPHTAKHHAYYFLQYLKWFKQMGYWPSAKAMLEEYEKLSPEERFKHVDVIKQYLKSKGTGSSDRRNALSAIKSFYEYHRLPLPRLPRTEVSRLFRPSESDKRRAIELTPLKVDEVRRLVLNSPQPYKAAMIVMFQSAMGIAEFTQFNIVGWQKVVNELEKPGPLRIDLYREKTSREAVKKYYTFISEDAKSLIKEWLNMRPKMEGALFLTFNKMKREWVPLRGELVSNMITIVAKKIGLIKRNGLNRYHVHAHEFRDLFKSLCTLSGVNPIASEFFLGHEIDKLGYDKSPQYDEEWFRNEYRKVEPKLNILSNPSGIERENELKKSFRRELLLVAGFKEEEINEVDLVKMSDNDFQKMVKEKLLGDMNNKSKQKVVALSEVDKYLAQGWEFVAALPNKKAIMRIPS